ncbi:SH3 domain-binding glutamic acid-rich-like protein 3 [Protopterus annectens]|uniref:SH3 domain-binding glutamic acid-rich-like protein 3 n=1 Tax=Protopterus annectens TaxID=7888 RepID=UPI001CFBF4B7|nr:SH3 domain-binding glutamic acid-rich-like protein 3 [Protopterus annectens]
MGIQIYYTSVTASKETKQHQQEMLLILDSQKIPFELLDLAINENYKAEMREKTKNPTACPPQIFNGKDHCGDYAGFFEAVENKKLKEFLKLK